MIDVPSDMRNVIRRWYPVGLDTVADARRVQPSGVHVTGASGSGVGTLRRELVATSPMPLPTSEDVASAAVVVFVVDASAPIGRGLLAELQPALESTTVAVVVNKIDVHRNWREVRKSVSSSIAEFVPRAVDVSVWPTSAVLSERARSAVDAAARTALHEESGIGELCAFVVRALGQPQSVVRARKYDAAVHAAAAGARREIVAKAREVTGTGATVGLRTERARLAERRDRERNERTSTLRSRLQLARAEVNHDIGEETRAFVTQARESVASASRSELRHLPTHLTELLTLAEERVHSRSTSTLRTIADDLEIGVALPAEVRQSTEVAPPTPRSRSVEDKVMVVVGASAGVGLARIVASPLAMLPALEIAIVPVSLILGALAAWWLVSSRATIADRAHLRTWSADAAASAKSSWEQAAFARVLGVEAVFVPASSESVGTATLAAESELERVESELRAAADRRAAVLAGCDRDLAVLDRGTEKFDAAGREPSSQSVRLKS